MLQHSASTRRLLGWVREVGRDWSPTLAGGDAVHGDYHPGNVLAIGQTVTGVVDWAIRHLFSPEVDAYVQLAETRVE